MAETAKTDANGRNRWGCNALLWACIAQREVDDGKGKGGGGGGESCLATARWLVEALGVDADAVNVNGHSALHKCAIYGHEDVAAWLVDERGCGTERHVAPDDRGQRPSDLARANGFDAFAERLRTLEDVVTKVPMLLPGAGAAK